MADFFLWTGDHFRRIENILGAPLSDDNKLILQNAHHNFLTDLDTALSRIAKTRAKLEKIQKVLSGYEDIDGLTEQVLIMAMPHTPCPSIPDLNRDLKKLLQRADIALRRLPKKDKPGPDEKAWPLRTLISTITPVFENTTGGGATLIKAKESKKAKQNTPSGKYFSFISEYLQIINYTHHSEIALMRIIEQVIYPELPEK